jgi:AraC-like DNA-binding protein
MASTVSVSVPIVFRHYVPIGPLGQFVALFWYYSGHDVEYSRERVLPMANTELVINLGSASNAGAGISGPRSESLIIERTELDELIGVHFKFGGAFPFLDFPLSELQGLSISLADVWGEQRAGELLGQLHEARPIEKKFQVLEQWLMQVMKRPLKHHPAVAFAMKEFQDSPNQFSSASMAERVGFSERRFIQLFRDEVGLTPKLFCRVQRFHEVIEMVHECSDVDWVDVALSCGYFDQAHFNHDFRGFCGLSPTEYLSLRTPHHNHVQVRD